MVEIRNDEAMERRRRIASRILLVLMAVLTAFACWCLYTGAGEGSLATAHEDETGEEVSAADTFYVLLIGTDSRKGTALYTGNEEEHAQVDQHADSLTLVRVDSKRYKLTLVSVPSNTVLEGEEDPIGDTLLEGDPEAAVDAVERLTKVDIPYYIMIDFSGFEAIIEMLDGLTIAVDATATSQDPLTAKNVIVGESEEREVLPSGALALARTSDEALSEGENDLQRQKYILKMERAIIEKVLEMDVDSATSAASALREEAYTNMSSPLMTKLVTSFSRDAGEVTVYTKTGPNEVTDEQTGYIAQDKKAWKKLMYKVKHGYNPNLSYAKVKTKVEQKEAESSYGIARSYR